MKKNCGKYGGEHGKDAQYFSAWRLLLSGVHWIQHDGSDPGPGLQLCRECHGGRGENSLQSQRPRNVSEKAFMKQTCV